MHSDDAGEILKLKKYILGIISFIILLAADQITKLAALTNLQGTEGIPVINGVFRLLYLENHGAAFGVLQNQRFLLLFITIIILLAIIIVYTKIPFTKKYIPMDIVLVLLAAGAVGNMIDRVSNGYVIDFLYFELIDFPIFNIADCYVVIAAIYAMVLILFYYKDEDFEIFRFWKK